MGPVALAAHEAVTLPRLDGELKTVQRSEDADSVAFARGGDPRPAGYRRQQHNSQVEMTDPAWRAHLAVMAVLYADRRRNAPTIGDSTWRQQLPQRAFLPRMTSTALGLALVWYDAPAQIRQLQSMTAGAAQQRSPVFSSGGWDG